MDGSRKMCVFKLKTGHILEKVRDIAVVTINR